MSLPRILITTYHEAFLVRGGGEFEIANLANSLKMHGAIADIYGPYSRNIDNYDLIIHFSVHGGGLELLRYIKNYGKPIILIPNFYHIKDTYLDRDLINAHVIISDIIIFKSRSEKNHFCNLFDVPDSKIRIIPYGVDSVISKKAPDKLFNKLYNIDNYAISFGIIEKNKNQLNAIRAIKDFDIPLVLVGKYRNKEYYDLCKNEASSNFLFIESLPYHSDIMLSALQESRFFIEVSYEPPGMSAIEAGLAGCNLVLSESDWSNEHFADYAVYVDPDDVESIKFGIGKIQNNPVDTQIIKKHLGPHLINEVIPTLLEIINSIISKK